MSEKTKSDESSSSSTTPPNSPLRRRPYTRSRQAAEASKKQGSEKGKKKKDSSFLDLHKSKISVGDGFQASIPDCDRGSCMIRFATDEIRGDRQSICLWGGNVEDKISNDDLAKFCKLARRTHNFGEEQALGILYASDMDLEEAIEALNDYQPMPDELSEQDEELLEEAFALCGKNLRRVRQLFPEKSMAVVVQYYYTRKKRNRKQATFTGYGFLKRKGEWGNNPENVETVDRSNQVDIESDHDGKPVRFDPCASCRLPSAQLRETPDGHLCGTCFLRWRRSGTLRRTDTHGQKFIGDAGQSIKPSKHIPSAPIGMALDLVDFIDFAPSLDSGTDKGAERRRGHMRKLEIKLEEQLIKLQEVRATAAQLGFGADIELRGRTWSS